jgi:hypothetical protein
VITKSELLNTTRIIAREASTISICQLSIEVMMKIEMNNQQMYDQVNEQLEIIIEKLCRLVLSSACLLWAISQLPNG